MMGQRRTITSLIDKGRGKMEELKTTELNSDIQMKKV